MPFGTSSVGQLVAGPGPHAGRVAHEFVADRVLT
jgi:hypothetical protein